jgi:predicted Rossmann-fold nucleotide-binding protein
MQTNFPADESPSDGRDGPIKNICVYCGSGAGTDPMFSDMAATLGRLMAENGIGLVYGGGNVGLMGIVARAVLQHGGHVTGIIPDFLLRRESLLEDVQETIIVPEQMTWAQLGRHNKPILLLSTNGFWKPLLVLLAHMREQGFIRAGLELNYIVAEYAEDVVPMLRDTRRRHSGATDEALIESRF